MQTQINNAFEDLNQQMLERQTEWALGRYDAVEAESAALFKDRSISTQQRYTKLFELAGGKGWYQVFSGGNKAMTIEYVEKNISALIAKRDAKIIKALEKKGITEIPNFTLTHDSNGYHGEFNVAGHKVTIDTILAGGYNIQCLHNRTLVKVK